MPGFPEFVFIINLASTLFMVGVIWFVQVVHYPLFAKVGSSDFVAYEDDHSRLTGYVVGGPMLAEAGSSVALLVFRPEGVAGWLVWVGFWLVVAIWASTVLLQIPRHRALGAGFNRVAHRFLVASNWIRTAAWTARGVLLVCIVTVLLA